MKVIVTNHAVDRWRERGAEYGDTNRWDVEKAFNESRLVRDDEIVPLQRTPDTKLYYHQGSNGWFVTVRETSDEIVIVTFKKSWVLRDKPDKYVPPTLPEWFPHHVFNGKMPNFKDRGGKGSWLQSQYSKMSKVCEQLEALKITQEEANEAFKTLGDWSKAYSEEGAVLREQSRERKAKSKARRLTNKKLSEATA